MTLEAITASTATLLGLAMWVVLARAGLVEPGPEPLAIRIAT